MEQNERARRAVTAHIRHEMRTPLNAIIGYSEILLEDAADLGQDRFVPDLRKIHASGQRLLALVDEVLQSTETQADREEFDLDRFGAHVRHELRTPLNAVMGYSELLLEEAADQGQEVFVPELQKIHTSAKKLLSLIDDIIHFPVIEASELTVESSDRSALSILSSQRSSDLVRDMVASVRPLGEDDNLPECEKGHLLVVDDSEVNRDLLSQRLARQGYKVAVAENGREALEMLQSQPFDLVLLDMLMPEMNGYQVLQRLKGDNDLRHVPVIMISALDEIDSVVRCIEMGAEDYLPKPFNPVLLKARIDACLEKKRLRDREVIYLRQIEEERKRSDELLHVILPHEIVEELKATNTVKPRLYSNVAVLFCDIVGFTPYCEQRCPEEVITSLQALIEIYEELTLRHGMQKIKTIGDSYMATAGLLRPVQNPVLHCVRCGLDMAAATLSLPAQWKVRTGIHIGPVMAGVVGHRQYLFDLWGDAVNTAARVESHGANGAVNLSRTAWELVSDLCEGESLGLVSVKGKGSMELFRVHGLKS